MKYRCWYCPCCHLEWVRHKSDINGPLYGCRTCHIQMRAGRTPKMHRNCVHRRTTAKWEAWHERYASRPRTRSGLILSPPTTVRAAWREVRRAKRRDSLLRRAQVFLDALLTYSRDDGPQPDGSHRYRTIWKLRNGQLHKSLSSGGSVGKPTLRYQKMAGLWGEYRRSLMRTQYEIALNPEAELDHLRGTLVHEVLHALDDEAHNDAGNSHDRLWRARLAEMYRLFPPTAR